MNRNELIIMHATHCMVVPSAGQPRIISVGSDRINTVVLQSARKEVSS